MRSHGLLRLDIITFAASCHHACCKLRSADLLQVENGRLAANCGKRTCCKLRSADLLQTAIGRLVANCDRQTCCKFRLTWQHTRSLHPRVDFKIRNNTTKIEEKIKFIYLTWIIFISDFACNKDQANLKAISLKLSTFKLTVTGKFKDVLNEQKL